MWLLSIKQSPAQDGGGSVCSVVQTLLTWQCPSFIVNEDVTAYSPGVPSNHTQNSACASHCNPIFIRIDMCTEALTNSWDRVLAWDFQTCLRYLEAQIALKD